MNRRTTNPKVRNPIGYGGLRSGSTNFSACKLDNYSNEIATAIPICLEGSSYPMALVVMLIDQTGSKKFKMAASKLYYYY